MKSAMGRLIVAGVLLVAQGALAEDSVKGSPASNASKTAPAASPGKAAPLMIVTVDRETGRLRPATPEERAALAAAGGRKVLARTVEATVIERRPDGSTHARGGWEFIRLLVAGVNEDGALSSPCVPSGEGGHAATAQAAAAAPEK